jgi:tetratricopeptide (TPR) repeat protein
VEAVRRVLLAPGDGNGAEASPRGEEGELGDDGGGGGGDEEDGASSWNAVAHAAAALDRAGRELFAAGDYDAAFLRYERALVLKRSSLGTKQQQRQGEQQDGEPPKAEPSRGPPPSAADGTSARAGQQQQQQPQPRADVVASVATSINNLTYLRQRAGLLSADESLAGYLRSLQMKREALGPGHLGVGRTLNNVGSAFYLKKEYGPALRAYTDARDILEASLGPDHGDVGTVASNIGDACLALGRRAEALERYRAALRIRWAALGPSDARVERLMQRVAALETGAQPERGGDESESDTDECLGAGGTEALFKEDIHALQEELEEDMKYFDLLERDMALNMLKDKMRIFREMRELSNDSSESDFSAEAAAPEQAIPSPSPGGAKGYADSDGGKPAVPPVSENPPGGPPARPRSRSEAGAEEGRAARRPESRAALTREDRDRALRSVRERLAGLRAGRQCLSESSGDDLRAMAGSVDLLSASDAGEPLPASPAPTSPARVSTTLSARHGAAAQE